MLEFAVGLSPSDIYTIVGPGVTCREDTFGPLNQMTNIIRTVPTTEKGDILDPRVSQRIRLQAAKECRNQLSEEKGKVILMNPSGTTDVEPPGQDVIQLQEPEKGTWSFVNKLGAYKNEEGVQTSMMNIGMNMDGMMPGNQEIQPGAPIIHISDLWNQEGDASQWVRENLPARVKDKHDKSIGKWGKKKEEKQIIYSE